MKKLFILSILLVLAKDFIAQDSVNINTLKSLADLRSTQQQPDAAKKKTVKNTKPPLVNLLGYYGPNDGGGGLFYYDDTASAPDNKGTIIRPSSLKGNERGRWIRIFDREVNVLWFGAKRDNKTDDYPAIKAALTAASTNQSIFYYGSNSRGVVYIPGGVYRVDSTIKIRSQVALIGGESGVETRLVFPNHTRGIDINYDNGAHGNYSVELKNLYLRRGDGVDLDSLAHGIWTNMRVNINNVHVDNFGGNGFEINTLTALGRGNANNFILSNVSANYCGLNGLYLIGPESNNGGIYSSDFTANGRCGVLDNSFLGNTYTNCHVSANGDRAATGYNKSWVRHKGKIYQCIYHGFPDVYWHKGIEPGTSETYWMEALSPPARIDKFADWNKDAVYFITGAYVITGGTSFSTLISCYSEGGQGSSKLNIASMAIGGDHGAGFTPVSLHMEPYNYYLRVSNGVYVYDKGNVNTKSGFDAESGLLLDSELPGHNGTQIKYFESDRTTKFFGANNVSGPHFEIINHGHSGKPFGLSENVNSGLHLPGIYFKDAVNLSASRQIFAASGIITSGEHAAGEFAINIGTDETIIGWKCIASGKPGKWVAVKTGSSNTGATPARGSYTGNGGSTRITIPHGLGRDPDWIGITIKSADAAGLWWATHDAGNIYINYKTATPRGSRNIVIDWEAKLN